MDMVMAEDKSCVLGFTVKEFNELKLWLINLGLKKDYLLLLSLFRKSFDKKQAWRKFKERF